MTGMGEGLIILQAHEDVVKNPTEEIKALFRRLLAVSDFDVGHSSLIVV